MKHPGLAVRGIFAVLFFVLPGRSAQAFVVSNQITHSDGVWCSRTDPVDLRIHELLETGDIRSIEEYSAWLKNNFVYRTGSEPQRWSSPRQVLDRRSGDCKDYSSLNSAVLKVMGFKPYILAIETPALGHAICVFETEGLFAYFDNDVLVVTPARDFDGFKAFLYERYRFSKLLNLEPEAGRAQLLALAGP